MSFNVKRKFSADTEYTWTVDFHPTEPWLLTGSLHGDIKIYNLESSEVIHSFSLNRIAVWCVKFIARKNWYVLGLNDGELCIFNSATHKEVYSVQAYSVPIICLAVHPTSPIILAGCYDKIIKAWDWDKQWENIQTYYGHTQRIRSIAFNPKDVNTFASASHDGTIKMWSIAAPNSLFTIKAHDGPARCVDFHPGADKPYLVTASSDSTVKVWNYHSQTCIQTIKAHTKNVTFAVFHPSLPIIISGSDDGTIKMWNNKSFEIEATLSYELGWANSIAFRKGTKEIGVGFEKAIVTLDLDSRALSMATMDGEMIGEPLNLEGQDLNKLTMNIKTDPEHNLGPARSLDDLTTAYDTALSLSPPPATSSQSHGVSYQQCITLAMDLISAKSTNQLIAELTDDKAQYVVDFLSKMVSDEGTFTLGNRKHILHLLSKLAKSAEVFPQSLELEGVECNLSNFVAVGGYGFIYKGKYEGSPVCIKAVQINSQGIDRRKMRVQASELIIWANLKHPNILPFLGIYLSKEEHPRICIVSPWMINGDLLQYLEKVHDAPRKPLVRDIISGLQYLHDLDIIHADLKAKNVLVSEAGKAMLADFGMSRLSITLTTNLTNAGIGTIYWMAPELLLDYKPHSRESDVWAFACTCYEILTGKAPFTEYETSQSLKYAFKKGHIIAPSEPRELGVGWDKDVWSVAIRCWKRAPGKRPKAHELLDMVNRFNFPDDRPSDPESQRWRKVDYDRTISILDEIRQSAAVLKADEPSKSGGIDVKIEGLAWLRRGSKKARELLKAPSRFLG